MSFRFLGVLMLGGLLAGCVTTTVTPGSSIPGVQKGEPETMDHAVASDPCAARLHAIAGAMLEYYAINKQLPKALDELTALKDLDEPIDLNCPASNLPYVYEPNGLEAPGGSKRIIVHDAAATHNGGRWCLLMAPLVPGAAPTMEVLLIPEPTFRVYLPLAN